MWERVFAQGSEIGYKPPVYLHLKNDWDIFIIGNLLKGKERYGNDKNSR